MSSNGSAYANNSVFNSNGAINTNSSSSSAYFCLDGSNATSSAFPLNSSNASSAHLNNLNQLNQLNLNGTNGQHLDNLSNNHLFNSSMMHTSSNQAHLGHPLNSSLQNNLNSTSPTDQYAGTIAAVSFDYFTNLNNSNLMMNSANHLNNNQQNGSNCESSSTNNLDNASSSNNFQSINDQKTRIEHSIELSNDVRFHKKDDLV